MDHFEIHPGVGVGPLVLGMSRDSVSELFGEPDEVDADRASDAEVWMYYLAGLELVFEHGFSYKLSSIVVVSDSARLDGKRVVGIHESAFQAICRARGIVPTKEILSDLVEYEWQDQGLSFYFEADCVRDVIVQLRWLDDETPAWPRPAND